MTLEPKKPVLTQFILETAVAGGSFALPSLKTQLPELYITTPDMSAEANTTITTQNPPDTPAPSNGTSLLGFASKAFDGNRDDAKEFMHSYIRWWKLNDKKPAFYILYK